MMKKDKTIVRKISDEQIIKAFLFTVEEYNRFGKYFPVIKKHTLLDDYKEDDYVAVQTKLMILRKYSYRSDTVYIPKVIEAAKNLYKDINVLLTDIQSRYDDIEKINYKQFFQMVANYRFLKCRNVLYMDCIYMLMKIR